MEKLLCPDEPRERLAVNVFCVFVVNAVANVVVEFVGFGQALFENLVEVGEFGATRRFGQSRANRR